MRPISRLLLAASLLAALAASACDSGETPHSIAGTVTLQAEQGVDFGTGEVLNPGNFANSDLLATSNGDTFRLAPGGPSPTVMRPASWIRTAGGVYQTFGSLDEVPEDIPAASDQGIPLQTARTGYGFVVANMRGGHTKGWVEAASSSSITIQFEPVALVPVE